MEPSHQTWPGYGPPYPSGRWSSCCYRSVGKVGKLRCYNFYVNYVLDFMITWFPARLCSRDGKLYYYGRLEYDFLAALPCLML